MPEASRAMSRKSTTTPGGEAAPSMDAVLSEDGKTIVGEMPELDDETLVAIYLQMVRARRIGERMVTLQRQGRIHTTATMEGEEAAIVGSLAALDDGDWVVPSYRERWATTKFRPDRLLPDAISLATQLPYAVGLAWGKRLQKQKECVLAYFGEGSSSEGDFYEACNLAGVTKAPVVFLCRNNGWAISVPISAQTAAESIAVKAQAFGFPGVRVDGMDVLAMLAATRNALDRARDGRGPTVSDAVTYRFGAHNTADDATRYRRADELALWKQRDPIVRMKNFLIARDLWDPADEEQVAQDAVAWVEASLSKAAPPPEAMFDHVLQEPTERMRRQRAAMLDLIADETQS